MISTNESAVSFKWLKEITGLNHPRQSHLHATWEDIRLQMLGVDQTFVSSQDWVSDYWICKGTQIKTFFASKWTPPNNLDEWPLFDMVLNEGDPTNYDNFLKILSEAQADPLFDSEEAVQRFYILDSATQIRGDIPMHQAQYVRAWLFCALGPLLMGIALSPPHNVDQLIQATINRLAIPRSFKEPIWGIPFSEGKLELLYNCRLSPDGYVSIGSSQVGQGDEWMKHWNWLSATIKADDALVAIQLAAHLLRSRPLIHGLLIALGLKDKDMQELSVGVIRRWLLTLKAMSWLEDALKQPWKEVRPQDLACFAFNSLKPEWPRRLISVSHRSRDVKPLLQATQAWSSSLFAIDATYVPAWETNTGMIWGLFANTPVIALVASENYLASEWCRREKELILYLVSGCDFHSGRKVWQIEPYQIVEFDEINERWHAQFDAVPPPGLRDWMSFPPVSNVYVPKPNQEWELKMLRAAGALRVFYAMLTKSTNANILSELLLEPGFIPPMPSLTNQPAGWEAYKTIFSELAKEFDGTPMQHLRFPEGLPDVEKESAKKFTDRIPDLSEVIPEKDRPVLGEVLVALEWMESLLPILAESNMSDMILIDLRGITEEIWRNDPAYSLARGIAALRQPPRPIWFIQLADQGVDTWGLLGGDRPIFTQYTDTQFNWMWEGSFSSDWPDLYADNCELKMSEAMEELCRRTRRE